MNLTLFENEKTNLDSDTKKVVGFDTEVYNQIMRFIRNNKRNSENTAYAYEKDIRNFFEITRGKQIEHVKPDDLAFTMDEIEDYYAILVDTNNVSVNTANRYFASVSECFRYLRRKSLVEDISFLEIKKHSEETNHYGILTVDEVVEMSERVKHHGKKDIGLIKSNLILFASDTASRISECLNLNWSNFQKLNNNEYKVTMTGKGKKKIHKIITNDFYEQLLEMKTGDKVFNIHKNTVDRMMSQLRREMNIPKERNITFHSFKKAGVDFVWKQTRDIIQAKRAANHTNVTTTQIYTDQEEDYGIRGFYSSSSGIDDKLYKKTDCKTLKEAIDSLDKGQQMYINMKIKELESQE